MKSTICAVLAATASAHVWAQTSEPVSQLEEVIVTAEKRIQRLQDVPASLSAVSTEQLESIRATQLADYAGYVPGLVFASRGGQGHGYIALRGLAPLGEAAAVGTYIDDTPVGSSSALAAGSTVVVDLTPYDVERIEVLRGPQGTLYGANALGGLLKYVTTQPDLERTEMRVGSELFTTSKASQEGWGVRGALSTPLIEGKLAVRGSFLVRESPGYVDNRILGLSDVNDGRQENYRVALLWQATSDLSVKLTALKQQNEVDTTNHVALDPQTLKPLGGGLPQQRYVLTPFDQELDHYAATVNWSLPWADLTYAASYSENGSQDVGDLTVSFGPLIPVLCAMSGGCAPTTTGVVPFPYRNNVKKQTHELRLSSSADGGFEWMLGSFYAREKSLYDQRLEARDSNYAIIPALAPLGIAVLSSTYEEKAVFGNATYHFTDRFDVSAGLRWARNEQGFDQFTRGPAFGNDDSTGSDSSESVVTYMANARLHLSEDAMIYARYVTGYRPGGPNVALPGVPPTVDSDSTTNYELGFKSELFNRKALLNATVFYIDWDDIQSNVVSPQNIAYLTNGGKARSKGVELETTVRPTSGLTFGLSGAYTDATILSGAAALGGLNGDRISYIPKWSGALMADYRFDVFSDWEMQLNGGYRYSGSRFSTLEHNATAQEAEAYGIVDATVALTNQRWSVQLFAKNLTDERAFLSPMAQRRGTAVLYYVTPINEPRTLGVSVDVRF
ncbi:TonB-dependent receptor [Steroidobacter flavus]|uniref:TonB-dependent receptor n=1 Tax=Steroidobacter flavus TaxID=1842136 RepID=A0ABV8SR86_9GAMM